MSLPTRAFLPSPEKVKIRKIRSFNQSPVSQMQTGNKRANKQSRTAGLVSSLYTTYTVVPKRKKTTTKKKKRIESVQLVCDGRCTTHTRNVMDPRARSSAAITSRHAGLSRNSISTKRGKRRRENNKNTYKYIRESL